MWGIVGGGKSGGMSGWEYLDLDFLFFSKGDFVDFCLGDLVLILKLFRWFRGLLVFLLKFLVRV